LVHNPRERIRADLQPKAVKNPPLPSELWFLNSFVRIRLSQSNSGDGVSILEHLVPAGDSPPLHVHRTEDEIFHVLDGDFRFTMRDAEQRVGPGAILLAPKGVPHTYRVESPGGGRFLTITARGDFEHFVRAASRPALRSELPEPAGAPSPEAIHALATLAARYAIEFVGPPLA
jgi:quercetin dioxygenase-like cupin family protein